jgi:hypothetical protein
MKNTLVISVLALFLISSLAFVIAENNNSGNQNNSTENNQTVCATDVKQCDDGTYVSRNPADDCEFFECPDDDNDSDLNETEDDEIECGDFGLNNCETNAKCSWDETKNKCRNKNAVQVKEKNRLREGQNGSCPDECTCTGSVTKCYFADGTREMTIRAGNSGNIIIQVKGINVSTTVELYKENGTLYGKFKNKTSEIILPDEVKEKIKSRIKQVDFDLENLTLDENGYYHVQTKKKARLFYIFPVREKTQLQLNAENGEVIKIRNPWWGFLAKDAVQVED